MDTSSFYAVVAGINFTLLGLWWVAVQERPDLRRRDARTGRMAYVVSLQFVVPGTASLLSEVAPQISALWRTSFAVAGLAGAAGIVLLVPTLLRTKTRLAAMTLLWGGVPLYLLVAIAAILPDPDGFLHTGMEPLQLEAVLFCLLVFLGAQTAWAAAMSPSPADESASPGSGGRLR